MNRQVVTLQDGLRIHTLVAGSEESPPLVLLHGYPTSAHLWRHCIPSLAGHFRVYAPDLPGHGQSDKPLDVDYDLDFFVRFLLGFYDALGLEQAGLVAHDLGGVAALGFVARHPERVTRFVIMDTAPYARWTVLTRTVIGLVRQPFFARLMLIPPVFKWTLRLVGVHRPAAITAETADLYRTPWVESSASRKAFSQVLKMPPERLIEPRENLRRIPVPTLVLWAERDRLLSTRIARQLQQDIPNAELITVPDCGHFLQEEQPDLVSEHLLSFLHAANGSHGNR